MGNSLLKIILIPLSLVLFCCTSGFSQDRVTELLGSGTGQRIILHEYAGINYILTVRPNDVLTVYTENQGILTELYQKTYLGLHNSSSYQTTKTHLILPSANGIAAYNFIENTEFFYPYPEGFAKSYWRVKFDKRDHVFVSLESADNIEKQRMLVNLEDYSYDILPNESWYMNITDHYIRERLDYGENEQHFVINKLTGERQMVYDGINFYAGESAFNDYGFVYKTNDDKAIMYYDNELHTLDTLIKLPNEYLNVRICNMTSYHVVFVEEKFNESDVYLFDKDHKLAGQYKAFDPPFSVYPEIVGNKIFGDASNVFTIDTSTGFSYEYNFTLNTYLIHENKILAQYGDVIKVLDLEKDKYAIVSGLQTEGYTGSLTSILTSDNSLLLNFDSKSDNTISLYSYTDLNLKISDLFNSISNGLSPNTEMQIQDDYLAIIDDQIHLINDTETSQINDGDIIPKYFGSDSKYIINDEVCWLQKLNIKTQLNCLKNGILSTFAPIPNADIIFAKSRIDEYFKLGDFVYYTVNDDASSPTLYKYNLISSELTEIGKLDLFIFNGIHVVDNVLYYYQNNTLYANKDGEIINAYDVEYIGFLDKIVSHKGTHFLLNSNGLYQLTTTEAQLVYPGNLSEIHIYGDYLFFESGIQQFTIYDGVEFHNELLDTPNYSFSGLNDKYLTLYNNELPGDHQTFIFNMESREMIQLEAQFNAKTLNGTFQLGANKMLVASNITSSSTSNAEIYKYEGEFENFELAEHLEHKGSNTNYDFKVSTYGGLINIGSKMYSIDNNGQFFPLESVVVDSRNIELKEIDNYFYFLAFDPILGRQVFRINSTAILGESNTSIKPEILVYPNPSNDYVIISLEKPIRAYQIYDQSGNSILQSKNENLHLNRIDISALPAGIYTLKLKVDNAILTKRLMKT